MTGPVRVLVVDDEPITADAHAQYVGRLDGFEVAGVAGDGREAVRLLNIPDTIDLILLDMNLPDTHGLDLVRRIRASGLDVDVIAITAIRDVSVVRSSVSLGIVQYLIKPFTYPTFAEKMRAYLAFRASFEQAPGLATQSEVDATMASLRAPSHTPLEKGLSKETLESVIGMLRRSSTALSATELGDTLHLSRVTARRYLENLVEGGTVAREPRYGTPGRPEFEYRWRGSPPH